VYPVTIAASFTDRSKTKDVKSLVALLSDKRFRDDPLELQKKGYEQLDAIRGRCSSVLDLLDLIRHHIRWAIAEQNALILKETIQDLVIAVRFCWFLALGYFLSSLVL
jgi:hypothetical protein